MFSLQLVADYPSRSAVVQCEGSTLVSELKTQALSHLRLLDTDYTLVLAPFGRDVVSLEDEEMKLSEAGVTHGATVCLFAPPSLKPAILPRGKPGEAKAEDEKDAEEIDIKKVLGELARPLKKQSRKTQLFNIIDQEAEDVINHAMFPKVSRKLLRSIIQRDTLGASELVVFEGCLRWGRAQLERKKVTVTSDSLRAMLGEELTLIRFPVMEVADIAQTVAPTNLLDQMVLLQLFSHCALSDEAKCKITSVGPFSSVERKGACSGKIVNFCFNGVESSTDYAWENPRGYDFKCAKSRRITAFCVRCTNGPGQRVSLRQGSTEIGSATKTKEFKNKQFSGGDWWKYSFDQPIKLEKDVMYSCFFHATSTQRFKYTSGNNNVRTCPDSDVTCESRYIASNKSSQNTYALDFLMM